MPRASLIRRTYSELELQLQKQEEVAKELSDQIAANELSSNSAKGYLYRQGSVLGWKKRYYILEGNVLSRYNTKSSVVPRGTLPIIESVVVRTESNMVKKTKEGRLFIFSLQSGKKKKYFGSLTEESREEWITAISNVIEGKKAMGRLRLGGQNRRKSVKNQMDGLIKEAKQRQSLKIIEEMENEAQGNAIDYNNNNNNNNNNNKTIHNNKDGSINEEVKNAFYDDNKQSHQSLINSNNTKTTLKANRNSKKPSRLSLKTKQNFLRVLVNLYRTIKYDEDFQKDEIESNEFLSVIGIELTRGNKTFTNEFLASGGIIKLAIALEKIYTEQGTEERMDNIVNEIIIIRCFKEIMDRDEGMKTFLLTADAQRPVNILCKIAFTTAENNHLFCTIIDLLTACCLYPIQNGHDLVLGSFDNFAEWLLLSVLTEDENQEMEVMTIRFQALVSYLDVTLPLQVRLSVMGLVMALANAGAARKERMLIRAELSCCGLDQQIQSNLNQVLPQSELDDEEMMQNESSLKMLCILYSDSKLEDEVEDEQEYFNEDLEGLFTRLERLLLQSSLAYGEMCHLLDQILHEYDKHNNIKSIEVFVRKCLQNVEYFNNDNKYNNNTSNLGDDNSTTISSLRNAMPSSQNSKPTIEKPSFTNGRNGGNAIGTNDTNERRRRSSSIENLERNELITLKNKNDELRKQMEKMKLENLKNALVGGGGNPPGSVRPGAPPNSGSKQLPPPLPGKGPPGRLPPPLPGMPRAGAKMPPPLPGQSPMRMPPPLPGQSPMRMPPPLPGQSSMRMPPPLPGQSSMRMPPPMPGAMRGPPPLPGMPGMMRGPPPMPGMMMPGGSMPRPQGPPPILNDLGPAPTKKMKNFNWSKVKSATARTENTVWRKIEFKDLSINYEDLEMLFGRSDAGKSKSKAATEDKPNRKSMMNKSNKVGLIDSKRQHNLSITLSRLSMPPADIVDAINNFKTSKLNQNAVELLKLISPEPDEIGLVRDYLKTNGEDKKAALKPAERFIAEILAVPRFNNKIVVFDLCYDFDNQIEYIARSLENVRRCIDSVLGNGGLKKALGTILMIGNFINHGNFRGAAEGFQLSSLEKLSQLRTNKPKECQSLLHFLAAHAHMKDTKILEVSKLNFNDVTSLSMTSIKEAKVKLQKNLNIVTKELKMCEQSDSEHIFLEAASPFEESARLDYNLVEKAFNETLELLDKFADFFCIDRKTFKFENVVETLKGFVSNFNKAVQENERATLLKKKREKLERERKDLAIKKQQARNSNKEKDSGDKINNGESKTVDRLISSMRNGDGDIFQRRRNSLNKRDAADRNNSAGNIEDSITALRQKVASKYESDEEEDSTDDDDWD